MSFQQLSLRDKLTWLYQKVLYLLSVSGNGGNNSTLEQGEVHGLFDYNDATTATTPIVITGGAGYTYLTNDEAGPFTNKSYKPLNINDIWDFTNNEFDFSELPLGSKVEVRLDLTVTTSSPNTQITGAMELGIGNFPYDIQWFDRFEKSSGLHRIVSTSFIYVGDLNTKDFPARFKVEADGNVDVVVNGWACYINLY